MHEFTYTTQGAMTPADLAEIRADMDLDLCGCCEGGPIDPDSPIDPEVPEESECIACGHTQGAHVGS